jgi:beta-galactosidase
MNFSIRSGIAALCLLSSIVVQAALADSPRIVTDLDSGWKFIKQDVPSAEQNQFDDSNWQSINLPHTWNNLDGQDGGDNYYRGVGWYRTHIKAETSMANKAIYLKFDAASINTTVYVNGKQAGTHAGCFGAFCFDVTPLLNVPGDNVIAVKVSNAKDPNVAPLSGDFTVFGGIYRHVHLIIANSLAISPIDDASSGVYVRQDKVDADNAALTVMPVVRNTGSEPKKIAFKTEVMDADGKIVASDTGFGMVPLQPGHSDSYAGALVVPHPHLWNGRKDPYLYTVRVSVLDGTTVTDVVEQTVGFRFFRVDPEQGFFLNGQPYRLLGVNRHQDRLDKGWAISLEDHKLDFANMMEMGCTGVRLSHYQHAQEFYDLCDRGGMVAWAELPLVNSVTASPEFDANASQQLRELIKQSFNHPAICFWSLSNEQRGPNNKPDATRVGEHEIELSKKLNAEAHELDPTRLTTEASAIQPGKPQDAITDVVGFNRYHGWYSGKPDGLGPDLDKIHSIYPNRGVALSEFGAGASISQHEANVKQPKPNGSKWHPEEWQCVVHEQAWAAIKPRTWIWGTFIWAEHDFAADQRNEGDHAGRNDKGMTTYDGKTKKDAFYFYKSNWSTEPTVYITDRRFSPRPVADAPVKIYSNCNSVELSLNGKSLGTVPGSNIRVFIWDKVQLLPGENKLEATGTRDGKTYTDSCTIVFDVNATDGHPPVTQPTTEPASQPAH